MDKRDMMYGPLIKLLSPYLLMASIAGYIYYQDTKIEIQNQKIEEQSIEIQTQTENIAAQKKYFEDKIKKEKFKIKYIERKTTIEKKVKKDEKDTTKSTPNRFYLN